MVMTAARSSRVLKPNARLLRWRFVHSALIAVAPAVALFYCAAWPGVARPSPKCLALAFGLWFVSGLGITVGYHRLFAHRAYETSRIVKAVLAAAGGMALQGPIFYWAALHRRHHELSDRDGDPHSPWNHDGRKPASALGRFLHAHVLWLYRHPIPNSLSYVPDLMNDPFVVRLNRLYVPFALASFALPALLGFASEGTWRGALHWLVWAGFVRLFFGEHFVWSINSLAHLYGRRDYGTRDESRNVGWLALPTLGESWHNTHHAFPSSASFSDRWWRIDVGGSVIRLMEILGLVWGVKTRRERKGAKTIHG